MSNSSSFVQRVLAFAPSTGGVKGGKHGKQGGLLDDSLSFMSDDFINAKSSLLAHADQEDDTEVWKRNLDRLRDQRLRPFGTSAVAVTVLSILTAMVSGVLLFLGYRQMLLADEDQDLVVRGVMACAGVVCGLSLIHSLLVARFGATGRWTTAVRVSDALQKVTIVAALFSAALVLRLWENEALLSSDELRRNFWTPFLHPTRTFVLTVCGAMLLVGVVTSVVSLGLPYRPSSEISASALRTLGLAVMASSLAACILGMTTVVSAPTTFFEDAALWGCLGVSLAVALVGVGLAGTAHNAPSTATLGRLWPSLALLAAIGSGVASGFAYADAVPEWRLPLVTSDSLFAMAVLGMSSAVFLLIALVHMGAWYVNEPVEAKTHGPTAHLYSGRSMYADDEI